ncbi:hypothetical protein PCANC_03382 [Puccinia coronata f. sp. avenae]|uniref:Uncharacterized protein n=1 Tax=Puccinia coronata f. sp. avenae TaxID=200324 RepID=A0A2N5T8R3_9BASI|nr:hypothetical protein PCANC_03382 [Puccinia coronata f. sp. avenae]
MTPCCHCYNHLHVPFLRSGIEIIPVPAHNHVLRLADQLDQQVVHNKPAFSATVPPAEPEPQPQEVDINQRRPDAGAKEIVKTTTAAIGSVDTDSNMVGSGIADKDHIDA